MGRRCLLHPAPVGPPRRKGRATTADDRSSTPEGGENSVLRGPLRVTPLFHSRLQPTFIAHEWSGATSWSAARCPARRSSAEARPHAKAVRKKTQDRLDTLPQRAPRDTIGRDRPAAVADIVGSGPLGGAPVRMDGLACPAWTT